jgi:hypothetical protein
VIVRHNTELLEKALEHVVRRASIPTLRAEAAAREKAARAIGFRRLATGAAIALAAAGIGLGVYLGTQPKVRPVETAQANLPSAAPPVAATPAPAANPLPMPVPAPPVQQPPPGENPPDTTNYTLFNEREVTLLGKTWHLEAGHFYHDAKQSI